MTDTVGVDIETQDGQVWCVGVADGEGRSAFRSVPQALEHIGNRIPVFHNAGFDLSYLDPEGTRWGTNYRDTLIEAHMQGFAPKNLPDLTAVFLTGEPLDKTVVKERNKIRFEERPQETLETCSKDAWATWALDQKWAGAMAPYADILEWERKVSRVLMDMKRTGMPVSPRKLKLARQSILPHMAGAEEKLAELGLNDVTSRSEFGQWFWHGKPSPKTTRGGALSTTGADLQEYATPEQMPYVEAFLTWHQLDRYNSTYLDTWRGRDVIHCNLNQTGTATWRYSSSNPNLQNVPKKGSKIVPLYQLFEAPPGWTFISFDYSQIELRVLAVVSQDKALLDIFCSGRDPHTELVLDLVRRGSFDRIPAELSYSDDAKRRFAKTLNFGIPYGMGGRTYAQRTGLRRTVARDRWGRSVPPRIEPDEKAGQAFIDDWYNTHPAVREWQLEQIDHAESYGYVEGLDGRPLWVHGIHAEYPQIRHHAEKQCGNYPIQFGAATIVKEAMIRCPEYLVMQVHDELLYLVPDAIAQEYYDYLAEALVDHRHEIPYTVDGHMGRSWGDIKSIEDIWLEDDEED